MNIDWKYNRSPERPDSRHLAADYSAPKTISNQAILISIIIPAFNRAELIGETLDSILAQTYSNWECVVVDDGSSDDTRKIVEGYVRRDSRISLYSRPAEIPKGANSCRNYGLGRAKGDYVMWFDSDDLMLPDNLGTKADVIRRWNLDFVVTRSARFSDNDPESISRIDYRDTTLPVDLDSFARGRIFWFTIDTMYVKRSLDGIYWDTTLSNGHEYNFNCKFLSKQPKGVYIDTLAALVRRHERSIMATFVRDTPEYHREKFQIFHRTAEALGSRSSVGHTLLINAVYHYLQLKSERPISSFKMGRQIYESTGFGDAVLFYVALFSRTLFNRYYRIYRLLQRRHDVRTFATPNHAL